MQNPFDYLASLGQPPVTGILQVGASSGQEIDDFVRRGISSAALIEPLDGPFAVLQSRCAGLDGYLPVQALCTARNGELIDYHVASNNGESSSILKPARHLDDYPWVTFPETRRLEGFTLDRIFEAIASHRPEIASAINMLYMDVQGAELEVLKGGTSILQRVGYVYTETGIGGGYDGDVDVIDLIVFLRAFGFQPYALETNAEGWGNALFINRHTLQCTSGR